MTIKQPIHKTADANPSSATNTTDQDRGKGAVESDKNEAADTNTNMPGQLGHRDNDKVLKDADSNLPG